MGNNLIGRVVDAIGNPIDGQGEIKSKTISIQLKARRLELLKDSL